jgi:hypothetical protein
MNTNPYKSEDEAYEAEFQARLAADLARETEEAGSLSEWLELR